jgi:hypothetical protein
VASSNLLNTSVVSFESVQQIIGKYVRRQSFHIRFFSCTCIQREMFTVLPRISIPLQELLDYTHKSVKFDELDLTVVNQFCSLQTSCIRGAYVCLQGLRQVWKL